jgi:tRNA(Ile)-lysidine synthase
VSNTALSECFSAHAASSGLLRAGQHVLVAVSGGIDSMVLLHLLRFGAPAFGLRLSAAHFDHGLRSDSAADAEWVRGICRAWRVPLLSGRAETPLRGENAAREARYAFLCDTATRTNADVLATGHQRDDQAETVLFRIARGTGLDGLAGIPERRGRVVRPLLPFTRADLLAYAVRARLRHREDSTNRSLQPARNRIRHVLLPALERARPGAGERLARIAALAGSARSAWEVLIPELARAAAGDVSSDRVVLARGVLLGYDPRSRARVVRYWAEQLGVRLGRRETEAVLRLSDAASGHGIALSGGLGAEREFDRIVIFRPARSAVCAGDRPVHVSGPEPGRARLCLGGAGYDVAWGHEPQPGTWIATFDADALSFPLELRGWRPGDRMVFPYGTKKLKKVFAEAKLGRRLRGRVPVLAEQGATGRVLWAAGLACAACARVRASAAAWHITVSHEREH